MFSSLTLTLLRATVPTMSASVGIVILIVLAGLCLGARKGGSA